VTAGPPPGAAPSTPTGARRPDPGHPLVEVLQGDLHPDGRGFTWWLPPLPAPSPAGTFNAALARVGLPPVDKAARLLLGGAAVVVGSPATDPVPDPALPHVGVLAWGDPAAELPGRGGSVQHHGPGLNGADLVSETGRGKARQTGTRNPPGYQGRRESHALITPALVGSGVYGAVHKLVDERCRYLGWRRDARRYAWRASSGTVGQLPAQMRGDSCWLPGRSRRDRDRTGIRWLSTRDLWMRVTGQLPMFVPRSAGTDSSHWLVLPSREVSGPVAAWPAGVPGRCWPRAEQGLHDLSGLAGRGVAPLVGERADELQAAAALIVAAGPLRSRGRLARVGDRA